MQLLNKFIIDNLISKKHLPKNVDDAYSYYMQQVILIYLEFVKRYLPAIKDITQKLDKIEKEEYLEKNPENYLQKITELINDLPPKTKQHFQKRVADAIDKFNTLILKTYIKVKTPEELKEFRKKVEEFLQMTEEVSKEIEQKAKEAEQKYGSQILLQQIAKGHIPEEVTSDKSEGNGKTPETTKPTPPKPPKPSKRPLTKEEAEKLAVNLTSI